jgi:perosamine synthetase
VDYRSNEIGKVPVPDKIGVYSQEEQALKVFSFYKSAEDQIALAIRAIQFPKSTYEGFYLVPISKMHLDDNVLINNLMTWRSHHLGAYADASEPTESSTANWLDKYVVNNERRILFLVIDKFGTRHGHLGIWLRENGVFELDNVLRSPQSATPKLFSEAVDVLAKWVYELLNLQILKLRVLKSNVHAVAFYLRNDFLMESTEYVKWVETSQGTRKLEPSDEKSSSDAWLVMARNLEFISPIPELISTAGPSITAFEIAFTSDAVKAGWNTHHSDYHTKFAKDFGTYVGAEYVLPTDSCTSALHLGLWALGIGPGDEVIVPDLTWVATANAVRFVGAKPIFADIDPVTWCIDPKSVRTLITSKTKAVIPVHLYGYVADIEEVVKICNEHKLSLLQDAAPGIGSTLHGRGVAEYGDFSAFSFQGAKLLVSGEGGALTTNNRDLYEKAYKISDFGRRPGSFWIESYGKKMKMSNLTASLALGQLQSVERQVEKKRLVNKWYKNNLKDLSKLSFQEEAKDTRSIAWMTSINLANYEISPDEFRTKLYEKGIDTRPVFPSISNYPIWENSPTPQRVADFVGSNSVNLPSGVRLDQKSVEYICETIIKILNNY